VRVNPARQPTLVLVEGASDRVAVETLARQRGLDLADAGATIVELGGATGIAKAHARRPAGARLAGLVDAGEERFFQHALEDIGLGTNLTRSGLEALGFFVCVTDLEDELIRALGTDAVIEVIEAQGNLRQFRTFQRQPAQRDRTVERQLHRFLGTTAGRKEQYARALVEGLDRAPRPLAMLVEFVAALADATDAAPLSPPRPAR
jgi:hypothetical protein